MEPAVPIGGLASAGRLVAMPCLCWTAGRERGAEAGVLWPSAPNSPIAKGTTRKPQLHTCRGQPTYRSFRQRPPGPRETPSSSPGRKAWHSMGVAQSNTRCQGVVFVKTNTRRPRQAWLWSQPPHHAGQQSRVSVPSSRPHPARPARVHSASRAVAGERPGARPPVERTSECTNRRHSHLPGPREIGEQAQTGGLSCQALSFVLPAQRGPVASGGVAVAGVAGTERFGGGLHSGGCRACPICKTHWTLWWRLPVGCQ